MIQWVHAHCLEWARFKRKALFGNEGWPPRTALGRLIDEGMGASHGDLRDRSPEVMQGTALQVSRALRKMADTHGMGRAWLVVHAHYVFPGRARVKAGLLEVPLATYWHLLHSAHSYLCATVEEAARE